MSFESNKKITLGKKDKSDKQSYDKAIIPLCDLINSKKDYYTTSSCAGRIILIKIGKTGKKKDTEFVFRKHSKVSFEEIKQALKEAKGTVWLRQEPVIVHICARNLDKAEKILKVFRDCGFKRSGAINLKGRIMLELLSTENLSTIVMKDSEVIVSDDYLKVLIKEANKKLEKTRDKLGRVVKGLS